VDIRPKLAQIRRRAYETLLDDLLDGVAAERRAAGEHVKHGRPERVHVRLVVDRLATRDLGRDVVRRSGEDALAVLDALRRAEIDQSHLAVAIEEDVRRLDVHVDEALRGGGPEALGDLQRHAQDREFVLRAVEHRLVGAAALKQLHHNERLVAILADVVHLNDVGVIEVGEGAGFAHRLVDELLVVIAAHHDLQRDLTEQRAVERLADDAGRPPAENLRQQEVAELRRRDGDEPALRTGNLLQGLDRRDIERRLALAAVELLDALGSKITHVFAGHVGSASGLQRLCDSPLF